jgi:hypothetical protein
MEINDVEPKNLPQLKEYTEKRAWKRPVLILLLIIVIISSFLIYTQRLNVQIPAIITGLHEGSAKATLTGNSFHPTASASVAVAGGQLTTVQPTTPGLPALEMLGQVTDQAFGTNNDYVPNGWGTQKLRIIRMTTGDLFTTYISEGSGDRDRTWHLLHKAPGSNNWEDIKQGDAGTEPINIIRGPDDTIHLFAWPGTHQVALHFVSTNMGQTFTQEVLLGQWSSDQGYSGASINAQGDIVFFQTGGDVPGIFYWTYYSPATHKWTFHTSQMQYRHTYAYFFPGDNNDLTIVAMRDVERAYLNYPSASGFDYIFNQISYFYIGNVTVPKLQQLSIVQVQPRSANDADITYVTDVYMDTQGRTHVLYNDQYDGAHQAIVAQGKVIKNVKMDISATNKARMIQDTLGHFYLITMDGQGKTINVYPGTAADTDGTQLESPTRLDISSFPGCTDYDFCLEPTFTVPRGGNPLSNSIDGIYGSYTHEYYFRINLRSKG